MKRRYVYDERLKKLVEITDDWAPTPRVELMTGSCYDDARTVEGADISSRRKRNEYMRRNSLADADDFKGEWSKAEQRRTDIRTAARDPRRRDEVGRAIYQLEQRKGSR